MKSIQDTSNSGLRTLVILSCIGIIVLFDEIMILPAIPDFIRDFGISYSTSSWLLSAYIIAAAVMTPIAGKLSDIYGKKKILLIVMAVYTVGVLLGRFATNIEFMLMARALQGVGMAMFPVAFGIIREVFPEKKLAMAQTIFSSTFPAGAVIGLVGGAAIIQSFGWQSTFLAVLPLSMALWIMILKFVHVPSSAESKEGAVIDRTIDVKGALALAATITFFLTGFTFMESDTSIYQIAGLFAASAASLAGFIVIEKKTRVPLLDFKLMKSRSFLPPTIILMLVFLSIFTVYLTVPVMVRSPAPFGFGGDALAVASVQLPFMIVFLIMTVVSGIILNKVKNTKLTMIGTVISTIGFLFLVMFHSTEIMVAVGLTIIAAGLSLSTAGGFNLILVSVPMQMAGIALGMTLLLNLVGMSVGPVFAGIIQDMNQGTIDGISGSFPTEAAYSLIFIIAGLISLASVVLAVVSSRRKIESAPNAGEVQH
ncbi:MAG: MFS transporter [Nitrosopumilaceae archaeon]